MQPSSIEPPLLPAHAQADPAQAMNFVRQVHTYTLEQIKLADTKAGLMAAATGVLLNVLSGRIKPGSDVFSALPAAEQWLESVRRGLGVLGVLAVVATFVMTYQAV